MNSSKRFRNKNIIHADARLSVSDLQRVVNIFCITKRLESRVRWRQWRFALVFRKNMPRWWKQQQVDVTEWFVERVVVDSLRLKRTAVCRLISGVWNILSTSFTWERKQHKFGQNKSTHSCDSEQIFCASERHNCAELDAINPANDLISAHQRVLLHHGSIHFSLFRCA